METPFNIGDTYYLAHHNPIQRSVPCPTCYGNKVVTLILGNGEEVMVQCECCGKGYEGPRGYIMEYVYEPYASQFTIAGVHSMYSGEWTLKSTGEETANLTQLYKTKEEALAVAQVLMQQIIDQNYRSQTASTKHQRENLAWSVRYHEQCIKDALKKIEWHRTKVSERKAKA
jgi:hypothetical protein